MKYVVVVLLRAPAVPSHLFYDVDVKSGVGLLLGQAKVREHFVSGVGAEGFVQQASEVLQAVRIIRQPEAADVLIVTVDGRHVHLVVERDHVRLAVHDDQRGLDVLDVLALQ
jgi:hypothetical protein